MSKEKTYNSEVTKENLNTLGDKKGNLRNDLGDDRLLEDREKEVDFTAKELDVPNRKLSKDKTNTSLKDEENQVYSQGSEQNENLEQDSIKKFNK
ncbi:hypothetical protein [Polaribacter sp.]|uniref:hypothetical protein n=1 Tax=Polaribacter sp. TaxID=1920175 RepID=UPI003F6D8359